MSFDWIDQYKRLRKAHSTFHSRPCTDEERGRYVEIAGTQIKGEISEEYENARAYQLKMMFEREHGLYEKDQEKLAELEKKVEEVKNRFYYGNSIHKILEGQALAIAIEDPSLEGFVTNALEAKLRRMSRSQVEALYEQYPDAYLEIRAEKSSWAIGPKEPRAKPPF